MGADICTELGLVSQHPIDGLGPATLQGEGEDDDEGVKGAGVDVDEDVDPEPLGAVEVG